MSSFGNGLQADVDRLQAVVAERLAEWQQRLAYRVVKLQKPWDSDTIEWDAAKQWEHKSVPLMPSPFERSGHVAEHCTRSHNAVVADS